MLKREINTVLQWGKSHIDIEPTHPNLPKGVTTFQAFLAIKPLLKGKRYWYALSNAYTSTDNLYENKSDIQFAFEADEPDRNFLMNSKERRYLAELPPRITIYRGMTERELKNENFGVSWSLKRKTAECYAFTYQRNYATNHLKRVVHKLEIDKQKVIAFFNGRKEFEIIYLHQSIKDEEYLFKAYEL